MEADRELDVVVFGATGFVGKLTAEYLSQHAPDGVKIGLAGRSQEKLARVKSELGQDWPTIVADSSDAPSMKALAECCRVVATTVGPYRKYGMPLVEACADAGTHYIDLTGEPLFIRDSIDRCHARAEQSGARIVHCCGFDSIPSDLGVLLLHEQAAADDEGTLTETVLLLVSMKGGVSGGTIDSLRTTIDMAKADSGLRRILADAYAMSPDRAAEPDLGSERDVMLPTRDPMLGRWVAPFVMGPYNSRVVRRSNALLGHAYGPAFRYREVMAVPGGPAAPVAAGAVSAVLGGLTVGMALPPTRALLDRVLPKPGEGPSEKVQRTGHFRMEVHTRTSTGARYLATVAAQGDPGYAATAVMFGESALCLGRDPLTSPGGVLTPAVAMGDRLVDRLRTRGFELSVARTA